MTQKRAVSGIAETCVYTIVHTDRLKPEAKRYSLCGTNSDTDI